MSLSLHFMATCTHLWWPILYTYLVLVIYSVYKEVCDCIIFKHTTTVFFSISTTSSWSSLYTSVFYGIFCLFTYPLDYLIEWCGYMCTYLQWRILYIFLILVTCSVHKEVLNSLFCTHTSLFWSKFSVPPLHVPSFYTREFYGLFCIFIFPWWVYLYILWRQGHVLLGTYCVHIRTLGEPICTYGTFWRLILYTYLSRLT